jgi:hypothetical protein
MKLRFYFVFAVFCFTAILLFAAHLRTANDRVFYQICRQRTSYNRLKQQLGSKQLRLESEINPTAVSRRLGY